MIIYPKLYSIYLRGTVRFWHGGCRFLVYAPASWGQGSGIQVSSGIGGL